MSTGCEHIAGRSGGTASDIVDRPSDGRRDEMSAVPRGRPALPEPPDQTLAGRSPTSGARSVVVALVALTKPRIIELLLVTTVPSMVLAAGGWPGTGKVVATLVGGSLSAGGANALNCWIDRELDAAMVRTARRPLPGGFVSPATASAFGCLLGVAGFAWLWLTVNPLAAVLSGAALVYYVAVYSALLKRRTKHNIVVGGAAGAVPVLVGWAAVTNSLGPPAWVLFAVVVLWTPPHFWALALRWRRDYERAGVPMLPVVGGVDATARSMQRYALAMVAASLVLVPVAPMGLVYAVAALVLGMWFCRDVWSVRLRPERAMVVFRSSVVYLALLFGAVAIDAVAA